MNVTITRREAFECYHGLKSNLKSYTGVKVAYAINKNLRVLAKEVEAIQATQEPKEGHKEYIERQQAIVRELGAPVNGGSAYHIKPENLEEYLHRGRELDKEFPEVVDEIGKDQEELEKFLDENVELVLHALSITLLDESLDAELLKYLMPFLTEDET